MLVGRTVTVLQDDDGEVSFVACQLVPLNISILN